MYSLIFALNCTPTSLASLFSLLRSECERNRGDQGENRQDNSEGSAHPANSNRQLALNGCNPSCNALRMCDSLPEPASDFSQAPPQRKSETPRPWKSKASPPSNLERNSSSCSFFANPPHSRTYARAHTYRHVTTHTHTHIYIYIYIYIIHTRTMYPYFAHVPHVHFHMCVDGAAEIARCKP